MTKKYGRFIVACVVLLAFVSLPAAAQFEGKIIFNSYDIDSNGGENQTDRFSMYLTKDRIMLEGTNQYNVIGSIPTEGILVRLDIEDFVFLTGEQTALKISRKDIDSMMQMFDEGSGSSSNSRAAADADVDYQKTGETRKINGYNCEKFIFKDKKEPNNHAEVWMTNELKINWGMLAEPWGNADKNNMLGDQLSSDVVFKDGFFPLRIEGYKSGNLRSVTEVQEISEIGISRAAVQIPRGVKVLSFQDYLFNKMSEQ